MNLLDYFSQIPTFIAHKLTDLGTGLEKYVPKMPEQTFRYNFPQNQPQPTPTPSPTPTPVQNTPVPQGTDTAMNYIRQQTPPGQQPENYYPALQNQQFLPAIQATDKLRQGLANLLLLQSFFESTLGKTGQGYFGAKPQGRTAQFTSPLDALNYQLGPNVLGGGLENKLNLLNTNQPLTIGDIQNLYRSYNPEQNYLGDLLGALRGGGQ